MIFVRNIRQYLFKNKNEKNWKLSVKKGQDSALFRLKTKPRFSSGLEVNCVTFCLYIQNDNCCEC